MLCDVMADGDESTSTSGGPRKLLLPVERAREVGVAREGQGEEAEDHSAARPSEPRRGTAPPAQTPNPGWDRHFCAMAIALARRRAAATAGRAAATPGSGKFTVRILL